MLFSIVIPNWNGQKFLDKCLRSLQKQTLKDFEIIVVDNSSSDDSVPFIKKNYPGARILELPKNLGFAAAANRGIKEAGGDLIALLNNDTEADKNWLEQIKQAADENPEAGFFASKMLDFKNHSIIDSCGVGITWAGRSFNIGLGEKDSAKYEKNAYVFGACGGAAIYRKELLNQIGLFDEDYFMYMEDVDLSFRAQIAGFKCLYVADAKVYHLGSGSSGGALSPFAFRLYTRNRWLFIFKNFPCIRICLNLHRIIYSELRYFSAALRDHFVKEFIQAKFSFLMNIGKFIKKRKQIRNSYKVTDKYMDEIIAKEFDYRPIPKAITK